MSLSLLLRRNNLLIGSTEQPEVLDTDGLIAYWNAEDAPNNGNWVDRINNYKLSLQGTTEFTLDGYRLNNITDGVSAKMPFNSPSSYIKNYIQKEFTCFIDCKIKFVQSKAATVIDFGSFKNSSGGISCMASLNQNGNISGNFKNNGNSTTFDEKVTVQGDPFPVGQYVDIAIKMGVKIRDDNKQEVYVQYKNWKSYAVLNTPINVNWGSTPPFGLGILYVTGSYTDSYRSDIIYDSIKLYNKAK